MLTAHTTFSHDPHAGTIPRRRLLLATLLATAASAALRLPARPTLSLAPPRRARTAAAAGVRMCEEPRGSRGSALGAALGYAASKTSIVVSGGALSALHRWMSMRSH